MVLTNLQRRDLHAGIYEYLVSQGPAFEAAAQALAEADPSCSVNSSNNNNNNSSISNLSALTIDEENDVNDDASVSSRLSTRSAYSTGGLTVATTTSAALNRMASLPVLERKWTAVPRLQKKILELEKIIRANRGIVGHKLQPGAGRGIVVTAGDVNGNLERRMLPRPPCNYELKGHSGVVTCVAIHPTSTLAISGSEDGMVKVWDHEGGEYIRTLKGHTNTIHSVDFTPNGTHFLSTSSDLTIKIWDFTTNTCIRTLRGHEHTVSCARFIPSSKEPLFGAYLLASVSRDKTVKFWDVETGYCQYTINDHSDWVRCIAVRISDGKVMATAGNDATIYIYNIDQQISAGVEFGSQHCVKVGSLNGHDHVIESLAFVTSATTNSSATTAATTNGSSTASPSKTSPDKKKQSINILDDYLASGSRDRTVKLWSIKTLSCIATFAHHKNWVRSVILHPSGNYILSSSDDRTIRVMEIKSQRCFRTITDAHPHFVTCLAMHHSQPILMSGGVDQTVRCWYLD